MLSKQVVVNILFFFSFVLMCINLHLSFKKESEFKFGLHLLLYFEPSTLFQNLLINQILSNDFKVKQTKTTFLIEAAHFDQIVDKLPPGRIMLMKKQGKLFQ
jgi:hypothetical protein